MKSLHIFAILLVLFNLQHRVISQSNENYLIYALDTAVNMQYRVKSGAITETERLSDVAEEMSRALTNSVVDKLQTFTTYDQGYALIGCILPVSTVALSLIWDVHDLLEYVYKRSLVKEVTDQNLLQIEFEVFYYSLMDHLYNHYYYLNDVLYQIGEKIEALKVTKESFHSMLGECFDGIY